MLIVDLEAGAESAQGGFGMARFSDRLRAPSKRKKDAISFEISTPSGSFGGWGINLWASAGFTLPLFAQDGDTGRMAIFGHESIPPRRRLHLPAGPELARLHFTARVKTGLGEIPHSGSFGRLVTSSTR